MSRVLTLLAFLLFSPQVWGADNCGLGLPKSCLMDDSGQLTANPVLGQPTGAQGGSITLFGSTSQNVILQPSANAGNWTFTLPSGSGSANQVLSTNGFGVASWSTIGTPGGSSTQLQYNNSGAFGGIVGSSWNGTTLNLPTPLQINSNGIITSPATATLQLGSADAASPVAQTFQVQSVITGTSNTVGANTTIKGSAGTGTGAGGNYIFQVAPAGGSGTSQNSYLTALTINSAGASYFGPNPFNVAVPVGSIGISDLGANTSGGVFFGVNADSAIFKDGATNLLLISSSANIQLGNLASASPIAQTLSVQNVSTGTSNTSGVNTTVVGSLSTGTGTSGDIILQTGGTGAGATTQNSAVTALTLKGATQVANFGSNINTKAVIISGTTPTNSGSCAINTQVGGNTVGSFKANGACAAGTVILTFSTTAANGWACTAQDLTTPADALTPKSSTTTTFTWNPVTMAASDLVQFQCTGF